jgi:hypothetical protein
MSKIEIRTSTRRINDIWRDFVQVIIGGLVFETQASSPEHARELCRRVAGMLDLDKTPM